MKPVITLFLAVVQPTDILVQPPYRCMSPILITFDS